jgi:hypothetical protein
LFALQVQAAGNQKTSTMEIATDFGEHNNFIFKKQKLMKTF